MATSDPFGVNPFSGSTIAPMATVPNVAYRVVGDYWTFAVTYKDTGLASISGPAGGGYTSAPTVTVDKPAALGGRVALAHAVLVSGSLSFVIDDPGAGYDPASPPKITLIGGGGTGALPVAVIGNPLVMTGLTPGAEIFPGYNGQPIALSVDASAANTITFGLQTDPAKGGAIIVPQSLSAISFPVRLHVFVTDALGHRTTYLIQAVVPVSPKDAALTNLPVQTSMVAIAGPAGPAGSPATDAQVAAAIAAAIAAGAKGDKGDPGPQGPPGPTPNVTAAIVAYLTQVGLPTDLNGLNQIIDLRVQGALQNVVYLSGTVPAVASLQGAAAIVLPAPLTLTGTVPASSGLIGTPSIARLLGGSILGSASLIGAANRSVDLAGSIPKSGNISGSAQQSLLLIGTVQPSANLAGSLDTYTPLSGAVPASASLSGSAIQQAPGSLSLSGSIPATAVLTGAVASSLLLQGSVPASAIIYGAATIALGVSGQIPSSASISGSAQQSLSLSGQIPASAALVGNAAYGDFLAGTIPASAVLTGAAIVTLSAVGAIPSSAALRGAAANTNTRRSPNFAFGLLGAAA